MTREEWLASVKSKVEKRPTNSEAPTSRGSKLDVLREGIRKRAHAFGAGFEDVATLGNAGPVRAVMEQPGGGITQPLAAIYNAMANTTGLGPQIHPERAAEITAADEAAMEEAPGSSIAGQITGAVGPGSVGAKSAEAGLNALGKRIPKMVSALGNTFYGKLVTNAIIGGGEGATYSAAKDEEPWEGFVYGAGGAGAGSLAQSAIGAGAKQIMKSDSVVGARQQVGEFMKRLSGSDTIDPDALANEAQARFGDMGTLMDVSKGAETVGLATASSANRALDAVGLGRMATEQIEEIPKRFSIDIADALPAEFKREAGLITDPRAPETVKQQSREYFNSLQPEVQKVLADARKNYPGADPIQFRARLNRALVGSNLPGQQAAAAKVMEIVDSQVTRTPRKGTPRPLKADNLWNIRQGIDDEIDKQFSSKEPDRRLISTLQEARKRVNNELNKVPGFKEVNRKYSTEASYTRSYDLGRNAAGGKKVSDEAVDMTMNTLNPADMQGFLEGFSRGLVDGMMDANGELKLSRNLLSDDRLRSKVKSVFGREVTEDFLASADRAVELMRSRRALESSSKAGTKAAATKALNPEDDALDLTVVLGSTLGAILQSSKYTSKAAGAGALRRLVHGQSHPEETAELVRLLSAQGHGNVLGAAKDIAAVQDMPPVTPLSLLGLDNYMLKGGRNVGQVAPVTAGLLGPIATGREE